MLSCPRRPHRAPKALPPSTPPANHRAHVSSPHAGCVTLGKTRSLSEPGFCTSSPLQVLGFWEEEQSAGRQWRSFRTQRSAYLGRRNSSLWAAQRGRSRPVGRGPSHSSPLPAGEAQGHTGGSPDHHPSQNSAPTEECPLPSTEISWDRGFKEPTKREGTIESKGILAVI